MGGKPRFRVLLPVAETLSAAVFGGVGLWQRHQVLNQRIFGDQTLWNSTARYHVWPRPFKFAVVTNIPAFLAGAVAEWPLDRFWPQHPEEVGYLLVPPFIALLWYWAGLRFDAQPPSKQRTALAVLLGFTLLCGLGVLTPGYIGYIYYGVLLWLSFIVVLVRMRKHAREAAS